MVGQQLHLQLQGGGGLQERCGLSCCDTRTFGRGLWWVADDYGLYVTSSSSIITLFLHCMHVQDYVYGRCSTDLVAS